FSCFSSKDKKKNVTQKRKVSTKSPKMHFKKINNNRKKERKKERRWSERFDCNLLFQILLVASPSPSSLIFNAMTPAIPATIRKIKVQMYLSVRVLLIIRLMIATERSRVLSIS